MNRYMAGLLHDIGILLLDRFIPEEYAQVRQDKERDLLEREREILGIDHGEIGALLIAKWKMPEDIVAAVRWHHRPDGAREPFLIGTQILHIADFACSALGILEPGEGLPNQSSSGAWNDLQVNLDDMRLMIKDIEKEIEQSNTFIEIGL